jgi:4-diphosphocytidyl-2-C-methyl-D-erythritol kinase
VTRAVTELAPAKLNLVLQVGPPRPDGMHPVCSLFASLDLADVVSVEPAPGRADSIECAGVEGENLAARALERFRVVAGASLPPLAVTIDKRIPVAAGLGGGSADAAAVLRAANALAGDPLDARALMELAAPLGSDVPSQVEPGHALVTGTGDVVEPVALPPMAFVLVPQRDGLSTAAVFRALDDRAGHRERLDPEALRRLAAASLPELASALDNDLEPPARALRPELGAVLERLRATGALGARLTGSGPTAFGVFADRAAAERAAAEIAGAVVTAPRPAS